MPIFIGTLARYFGLRFLSAVLVVFAGIFVLVALIDYIELMRRAGDIPNVCRPCWWQNVFLPRTTGR